jgi:penicillin-insensitive murein DD-endopeptidase
MKYLLILILPLCSCIAQDEKNVIDNNLENSVNTQTSVNSDSLEIITFYKKHVENEIPSRSGGTVSKGNLENGKIMPFFGTNFTYFDKDSYLGARAFTSDVVKYVILDAYEKLSIEFPNRKFFLMELSHQHGGKLYPHRTHQNGLSVDFMMPKLQNGVPNYSLDTLGKEHYFLDFNDNGEYTKDTTIKIDFDLIAKHILLLNEAAKKQGYKISKVIIKVEYKNNLFETPNGKILKNSGIYIVKSLSPLINSIHDDHYHVDFEKIVD